MCDLTELGLRSHMRKVAVNRLGGISESVLLALARERGHKLEACRRGSDLVVSRKYDVLLSNGV